MPIAPTFIGQKPPSALHSLLGGVAEGQEQQRQSAVLRDVLLKGDQQDVNQQLINVLTAPVSDAQKQNAINVILRNRQLDIQQERINQPEVETLSQKRKAKLDRVKDVSTRYGNIDKIIVDPSRGSLGGTTFRKNSKERRVLDAQRRELESMKARDRQTAARDPNAPLLIDNPDAVFKRMQDIEVKILGEEGAKKREEQTGFFKKITESLFGDSKEEQLPEGLPSPAQFNGQQIVDNETGKVYQSNGAKWILVK